METMLKSQLPKAEYQTQYMTVPDEALKPINEWDYHIKSDRSLCHSGFKPSPKIKTLAEKFSPRNAKLNDYRTLEV